MNESAADQVSLLQEVALYSVNPYTQHFSEHMYFEYIQSGVPDIDLDNDVVTVSGPQAIAEKLAFSHGMARYSLSLSLTHLTSHILHHTSHITHLSTLNFSISRFTSLSLSYSHFTLSFFLPFSYSYVSFRFCVLFRINYRFQ
jgi:uncharacterized Rmd1/YagE family protein